MAGCIDADRRTVSTKRRDYNPGRERGLPTVHVCHGVVIASSHREAKRNMMASVFVGTSVDGFIARPNGALDFLPPGGGEPHGYVEFMATIDAIVIGRKTFETVLTFPEWPYERPVIVLSTHPEQLMVPAGVDCEVINASPAEVVDRLSKRGIAHVYVDGGVTVQRFLAAGLIKRLIITRVPVLIGEGVPLFGRLPHDIRLEHIETRSYRSGLVRSEYQVVSFTA